MRLSDVGRGTKIGMKIRFDIMQMLEGGSLVLRSDTPGTRSSQSKRLA